MSRKPKSKKSFYQKIAAFFMLLTGGAGVGGWQLKDHPVAHGLVSKFTGQEVNGETTLKDLARKSVTRVVETTLEGSQPGVYEVSIDKLTLDPSAFKPGQRVDILARVRTIDDQGVDQVVWDSAETGTQRAVVGRDELSASWKNRPFKLDWAPGQSVVVEVYGRQMLKERVLFRTDDSQSDSFPLRSGTVPLANLLDGKSSGEAPTSSSVQISSKRLGNPPGAGQAVARRPGSPVR